jgi:hypothetical protein
MKKRFKFLAKQKQHNAVYAVLLDYAVGEPWMTEHPEGVMVSCYIKQKQSKRAIDRALFAAGVPGAVKAKSKKLWSESATDFLWTLYDQVGGDVFSRVYRDHKGRKKIKKSRMYMEYPGCDCCGPHIELEDI